jgi:hypothetical protein
MRTDPHSPHWGLTGDDSGPAVLKWFFNSIRCNRTNFYGSYITYFHKLFEIKFLIVRVQVFMTMSNKTTNFLEMRRVVS